MGVSPSRRSNGGVSTTGGGDLSLPPLEKVAQFIASRPIMDLCLAAERRLGSQVAKQYYEQD